MKKNYIILLVLLITTVSITLLFASLYKKNNKNISLAYETLNKIKSEDFEVYLLERPDVILYIGNKYNNKNNKFEKKFIKKIKEMNLMQFIVYIEEEDFFALEKKLKKKYSYEYEHETVPVIFVISDNKVSQIVQVTNSSSVNNIIDYEVFK